MAEITCKNCDEVVSGPDEESVKETMARHTKAKHSRSRKVEPVTRNPKAKK